MSTAKITEKTILGYCDYKIDRKTKKDFLTLDSIVNWINRVALRETETTKEFWDFAEETYSIDNIIKRMEELYPDFPYLYDKKYTIKNEIQSYFEKRNLDMKASDFEN